MIAVLTYISLIAGGLLVLLLLTSIFSGLDWDLDIGGVGDADAGGVGVIKGGLTFISIGSWVVKLLLVTSAHPVVAITAGLVSGGIAVALLVVFMRFLLSQQSEVNWQPSDALFKEGKVYLRIPEEGSGIVNVNINGGLREIKAKSKSGELIPTGTSVLIEDVEGDCAIVSPYEPEQ